MGQLSFEGAALSEELSGQGYTLVDHGIPANAIDELIGAYAAFTDNLPDPEPETIARMVTDPDNLDALDYSQDSQAEWHKYRTNHPFIFKPGGYSNRSVVTRALREIRGIDIADDPKEFYHFVPSGLGLMNRQAAELGWGLAPPEVNLLNLRFGLVHRLGAETVHSVMAKVEETHPEILPKYFTRTDLDTSPVRLLFYHPSQGDVLAGGHYDKSFSTLQIAESHKGLRVRNPATGEMQVVNRPPEKGVVFPGALLSLPHVYPDSPLEPAWHDVVKQDELNEGRHLPGPNVARWAIIFFANSLAAGEVPKTLMHTEIIREPQEQVA